MLAPRWRKVGRDLIQNRSRTVFVVMSVAVGVFAVTVILGARGILLREFDNSLASSNPAAVTIYTTGFDRYQANAVGRVDGVGEVESRTRSSVRYILPGSTPTDTTSEVFLKNDDIKWKKMTLDVLDDFEHQNVDRITSVEGQDWPPGRDEIIIEQSALKVSEIHIGDYVTVEKPNSEGYVNLKVVGIAHDINALPAQFGDTPITGFVSPDSVADMGLPSVYTTMLITSNISNPTRADYEVLSESAQTVLKDNNVAVLSSSITNPGSHFMGDIFKAVALLLLVMGVLSLFLSGFLVVNTINALMAGHVKQIGIMKAVGGKPAQVVGMYVAMMLILSVAALIIGVPAAAWVGQWLINYAIGAMNFRVESMIPPFLTMVISIVVGILVPIVSSLGPIVRGAKTPIVKAFNPAASEVEKGFGHGFFDRILGKIRGLPRPIALSLRNTFQRKGRLITTLATLLLACAMIMAVISIRVGVKDTVSDFGITWTEDITVHFSGPQPENQVQQVLEGTQGVAEVEMWANSTVAYVRPDMTRDESVALAAVPPNTQFYHPDMDMGRWLSASSATDEICVSTGFVKNNPEVRVGNTITLDVDDENHAFKVVGIFPALSTDTAAYVSKDVWQSWTGKTDEVGTAFISTEQMNDAQTKQLGDTIDTELNDDGYKTNKTSVRFVVQESFGKQMDILVTFLFIMAVVLGAVGVIGLSGTMMINVVDSTREIGVMRAIGASHKSIYSIFITEGVVIAIMAWFVGAILSWPLSYLLSDALGSAIGFPLTYHFSYLGVFITLGIVLAISVLASLLPSWRASAISVRDAISYE